MEDVVLVTPEEYKSVVGAMKQAYTRFCSMPSVPDTDAIYQKAKNAHKAAVTNLAEAEEAGDAKEWHRTAVTKTKEDKEVARIARTQAEADLAKASQELDQAKTTLRQRAQAFFDNPDEAKRAVDAVLSECDTETPLSQPKKVSYWKSRSIKIAVFAATACGFTKLFMSEKSREIALSAVNYVVRKLGFHTIAASSVAGTTAATAVPIAAGILTGLACVKGLTWVYDKCNKSRHFSQGVDRVPARRRRRISDR